MTRRCPGCRTAVTAGRPWCGPCEGRLPERVADQVAQTRRQSEVAHRQATAWLETHPRVSTRELDAIRLVARGMSTQEVAAEMGVTELTAKTYLDEVSKRWGTRGRAGLVARCFELGYLEVRVKGVDRV